MAIYSLKHEGQTLKQLKKVIAYNTNDKDGLNSLNNPRLISVTSNIGYCENTNNKDDYNDLIDNFIMTVDSNSKLSKNNRQRHIYDHSVISFSEEDDKKYSIKELEKMAIETAKLYEPGFEDTPYLIYPQMDSGKLHYHVVRGLHDDNGDYHRVKNSKLKMQSAAQKIEKKHNLTLTGKNNPENYIFKMDDNGKMEKIYFPKKYENTKISKNKKIENNHIIDLKNKEVDAIDFNKSKIVNKKNKEQNIAKSNYKKTNDFVNDKYSKIEKLKEPINYSFLDNIKNQFTNQKELDKEYRNKLIKREEGYIDSGIKKYHTDLSDRKIKVKRYNSEIDKENKKSEIINNSINSLKGKNRRNDIREEKYDTFKTKINDLYKKSENAMSFLKLLNDENIEISVIERKNRNGGITFTDLKNDISLSGSKVNSYFSYGKMKKNDKHLFDLIHNYESNSIKKLENDYKNETLKINDNYKKIEKNGETLIYYKLKDNEKRPYNYNLKISENKDRISFGQNSNDFDLRLSYQCAKEMGWKNATSENKELSIRLMKIAYSENKDDLLFFRSKEKLSLVDLKEVTNGKRLKTKHLNELLDNDMLHEKDAQRVKEELKIRGSIQEKSFDCDEPIKNSVKVRFR
ncbi:hypothetical protein [Marinomonas pollencensis]|uniref:Relaxase/mobilization nuclease-like protein n=1 Tax=Marinomonas pollencensis TaxID=491954 RepID=A0A3E0DNJ3_9GAMM|nr:hypothetical protein [Marinomonas pollencensis]REG84400.1 hypothetical protein DFP81_104284 [Marinomonas pollencensis]